MKIQFGVLITLAWCAVGGGSAHAQTFLSEDFEQGVPNDWAVFITVPAITTWHALTPGECGNATGAAGFTGANCLTGARSFPSSSGLMSPSFQLSGVGPYTLEFDSILLMNLSFDAVSVSAVDDMGNQTVLLDQTGLNNNGLSESISVVIPNSLGGLDISIGFFGDATFNGSGGLGWLIDNVEVKGGVQPASFCFGDGSANPCPCGNNVPAGNPTGCLNSSGVGASLDISGNLSVTNDSLRFDVAGAPPTGFGILVSGDNQLPSAQPGLGIRVFDGLRCVGGNLIRHGGRSFDNSGANITPWGAGGNPPGGLIAQGGFVAGQTRHWQVFYRDLTTAICQTGRNFTSAVSTTFAP